jgi:hypothetical protein
MPVRIALRLVSKPIVWPALLVTLLVAGLAQAASINMFGQDFTSLGGTIGI